MGVVSRWHVREHNGRYRVVVVVGEGEVETPRGGSSGGRSVHESGTTRMYPSIPPAGVGALRDGTHRVDGAVLAVSGVGVHTTTDGV